MPRASSSLLTNIPDDIMVKARELLEANMVMGEIDDDTAVFTVAGLLGDIAALLSERTALEAANTRLTKELADLKASFDANVNEMSQRFRAVNIAEVIKQSGVDFVTLSERLAASEARVAELEKGLGFYADPKNWIDTPPWDGDPESFTPKAIPVLDEEGGPCDCGDTARAALTPAKENIDGTSE